MKIKNSALCALGLAAAITVSASAQNRTPSETRIPVRKDQPAEPMPMKTDTVYRTRVDTVMMPGRTETMTVTRVDTVVRMQMLPMSRLPGFFFGLGAGVAVPTDNWRNVTKDGPTGQVHIGYYPGVSPFGIRFDANYSALKERETGCANCPQTKILSGSGDVLLRMPLDRTSKLNPVIYALGGGGVDKITDFLPYRNSKGQIVTAGEDTYKSYPGLTLTAGAGPATAGTAGFTGTKSMFYHWEVGGGLEFNAGPAHLFVETRYKNLNTIGGTSHYFPIVAGLNFGY